MNIPYCISDEAITKLREDLKIELELVINSCKTSLSELEKYGDCECSGLQSVWKIFKLEGKLVQATRTRVQGKLK